MNASFYLDQPEQAGYSSQTANTRHKADYLRMLRGWGFDADGREGAALKGWVESRFGLLPRHHAGQIRDFSGIRLPALSGDACRLPCMAPMQLKHNSICSIHIANMNWPSNIRPHTHLTLYRGVNRVDDYETLATIDKNRRVVLFNNLSSFTSDRDRADEFGDYLLTAQVPLSKIFYHTLLLPGLLQGEDEFTVIGGLYEVSIAAY
jgi:NAD+--dinitrogen-reductase ADP-D-ribosyltransferase